MSEQPVLLANCPENTCGLTMTHVRHGDEAWPVCICCGGSGLEPDRYCPHRKPPAAVEAPPPMAPPPAAESEGAP